MSNITVGGIVTRYANYKESDRILTILTKERGLITVSARGCRRQKSQLLSASELFVAGEFTLFCNKERYSLNDCDIAETFFPLREDIDRFSAAAYAVSLVNAGITDENSAGDILQLLMYSLTYISYSTQNPTDAAICFAIKFLGIIGYCPTITFCASCGKELVNEKKLGFSAKSGGALCSYCNQAGEEVSVLALEALRRMLLLKNTDICKVKLPLQTRGELLPLVNTYAEYVLERNFKAMTMM